MATPPPVTAAEIKALLEAFRAEMNAKIDALAADKLTAHGELLAEIKQVAATVAAGAKRSKAAASTPEATNASAEASTEVGAAAPATKPKGGKSKAKDVSNPTGWFEVKYKDKANDEFRARVKSREDVSKLFSTDAEFIASFATKKTAIAKTKLEHDTIVARLPGAIVALFAEESNLNQPATLE